MHRSVINSNNELTLLGWLLFSDSSKATTVSCSNHLRLFEIEISTIAYLVPWEKQTLLVYHVAVTRGRQSG